jgi:hypothetical protein
MLKKYIFILLATTSLGLATPTDNNTDLKSSQNNPTFLERAQHFYNNNGEFFETKNLAIGSCAVGVIGLIVSSITRKISYLLCITGISIGSYKFLQSNDEFKNYLPSPQQISSYLGNTATNFYGKINQVKESLKK